MGHEPGRLGGLFASKAFVQLIANPLVGKATLHYGYELPFLTGTGLLILSSFSKFRLILEYSFYKKFVPLLKIKSRNMTFEFPAFLRGQPA